MISRLLCTIMVGATVAACSQAPVTGGPHADPALRDELLALEARDRAARGTAMDPDTLGRFRRIIDQHGWPGRDAVGEDASNAAATLALHADADPAFQRRCLELMQAAQGRGEAPGVSVAYLTDRVLVNEGKPQRYGTRMTVEGDQVVPSPIEDADHVDERRAAVGLPPMAEYRRKVMSALAEIKAESERPRGR